MKEIRNDAYTREVLKMLCTVCNQYKDDCMECPLLVDDCCYLNKYGGMDDDDAELLIDRLNKWVHDGNELRYPTIEEWQKSMYPDSEEDMKPCMFVPCSDYCDMLNASLDMPCFDCLDSHVPEAFAKKLGIEKRRGCEWRSFLTQ